VDSIQPNGPGSEGDPALADLLRDLNAQYDRIAGLDHMERPTSALHLTRVTLAV
jgi:hypothetical protein